MLKPIPMTTVVVIEMPAGGIDPSFLTEAQRQLEMQLTGLGRMTAKDWLCNFLLNRMKTTEQIIKEDYGTKTGKLLAEKIDTLLLKRRDLALFLMEAIQERIGNLLWTAQDDAILFPHLCQIYSAAADAKEEADVYLAFRSLGGLNNLAVLNEAGLLGGIGRQHGEGDEVWFRERFSAGIELIKLQDKLYEYNAILHNPDQCAGGPVEILWQPGDAEEMENYRQFYHNALTKYQKAVALLQSYSKQAPLTKDGIPDTKRIGSQEDEVSITQDEAEQATACYIQGTLKHLGNYTVNSWLGRLWMSALDGGQAMNRVDLMFSQVLTYPLEKLSTIHVQVKMEVVPAKTTAEPQVFPEAQFPDVDSALPKDEQGKDTASKKKKTAGERLEEIKEKRGPQQQTLHDQLYAPSSKQPEKKYPTFDFQGWEHGPQVLPKEILDRGLGHGDIIVINGRQYRVVELKNKIMESTTANPLGKVLYVVPRLHGG